MIFIKVFTLRPGFTFTFKKDEVLKLKVINNCIKDYLFKLLNTPESIVPITGEYEIKRSEHGKPYVDSPDIEFSISDTGMLWGCAVSDSPVGLDIQSVRPAKTEQISKKYFTEGEREYVRRSADQLDAFYDIWVRKEAFVKLLGRGLGYGLSKFEVADENGLYESVNNEEQFFFTDISGYGIDPEETMPGGVKGVICAVKKDEIVVRCGLLEMPGEE